MSMVINKKRIRKLNEVEYAGGPVIYWMSRDQRVSDNWALIYARQLADKAKVPLAVVFCLSARFLDASYCHYEFMLDGLGQVEKNLRKLNIPMFLPSGRPEEEIAKFIKKYKAGALVADFSPLKISRKWKSEVPGRIKMPFYEVDSHNIVPVWEASQKLEYAAYTIRPRINRLLDEYLEDFPRITKHKYGWMRPTEKIDWNNARRSLTLNRTVTDISRIKPGERKAHDQLFDFLERRLGFYAEKRNDPNENAQSGLSPYLHFGQLSAQRVALEVQKFDKNIRSQEAFLEELIVRRELADNFCFYNDNYDNFEGFPEWARETLNNHRRDKRPHIYLLDELEIAKTHDDLWNASQMEMVYTGKMHGYMRMYWAKKILEWSRTPEEALKNAIYLNDKYELDGRDPNGYAGIAWSIGGVHDRAWPEREVFGKIRYMNYNGCRRKFDVSRYIDNIKKLAADYR
jgi:deoxyribodipyrimidine photo-lyase